MDEDETIIGNGNKKLTVRKVVGDGNCLFNALTSLIFDMEIGSDECRRRSGTLRQEVVRYIREHIERFWTSLVHAGTEGNRDRVGNGEEMRSEQQIINGALRDLGLDRRWGGEEVLLAVAEMYNRRIVIYTAGTVSKHVFGERNANEIHLLYSNGNHYDVLTEDSSLENIHDIQASQNDRIREDSTAFRLNRASQSVSLEENILVRNYKIATWNIQGGVDNRKREKIDDELLNIGVNICGIQETNMTAQTCYSQNYNWYLSNKRAKVTAKNKGIRNGVGMVIRKNCGIKLKSFSPMSRRRCYAVLC